jgi:hypothetical protein
MRNIDIDKNFHDQEISAYHENIAKFIYSEYKAGRTFTHYDRPFSYSLGVKFPGKFFCTEVTLNGRMSESYFYLPPLNTTIHSPFADMIYSELEEARQIQKSKDELRKLRRKLKLPTYFSKVAKTIKKVFTNTDNCSYCGNPFRNNETQCTQCGAQKRQ